MKKLYILALALCCFLSPTLLIAQSDIIRFGVLYSYPPFVRQNALGESYGFDIAIAKSLCKQLNKKCVFVPMSFFNFFPSLDNGSIDAAISAIVITPARIEKYDFTIPYYYGHMNFLTTINNNTTASAQGLVGKKAGAVAGTVYLDYLKANYPNTTIKKYPHATDAIADLSKGNLDVFLIDSRYANWWVMNGNNQFKLAGAKVPLPGNSGYGILLKKGNTDLLNMLNDGLQAIMTNGTENQIINLYLRLGG